MPHVVVVEGLERLNDLWDYAVKPLMPDRPSSDIPDEEGHGSLLRVRVVDVRFRDSSAHQT